MINLSLWITLAPGQYRVRLEPGDAFNVDPLPVGNLLNRFGGAGII